MVLANLKFSDLNAIGVHAQSTLASILLANFTKYTKFAKLKTLPKFPYNSIMHGPRITIFMIILHTLYNSILYLVIANCYKKDESLFLNFS